MKIGYIGLGAMGAPMTRRLTGLEAGGHGGAYVPAAMAAVEAWVGKRVARTP